MVSLEREYYQYSTETYSWLKTNVGKFSWNQAFGCTDVWGLTVDQEKEFTKFCLQLLRYKQ